MNDSEIINEFINLVYYIARSRAKQPSDADDICQEVFLRYVSKKPKFEDEDGARGWFITVTFNVIKNFYKSAYTVYKVEMEQEEYENRPSDRDFAAELENDAVFESRLDKLEKISPECKTVMLLKYGWGYTIAEISRMTGTKPDRVKALLMRGKREYRGIVLQEETGQDYAEIARKETI